MVGNRTRSYFWSTWASYFSKNVGPRYFKSMILSTIYHACEVRGTAPGLHHVCYTRELKLGPGTSNVWYTKNKVPGLHVLQSGEARTSKVCLGPHMIHWRCPCISNIEIKENMSYHWGTRASHSPIVWGPDILAVWYSLKLGPGTSSVWYYFKNISYIWSTGGSLSPGMLGPASSNIWS